ncbi:uncharacterized protein LOC143680272 [Tamandua tetradactyla]|uniref:uncharacterized protein LOC143680272 n=1 Tax=Tamandua tetradactyla TaxID=48850 RepID=UPI004053CAB3
MPPFLFAVWSSEPCQQQNSDPLAITCLDSGQPWRGWEVGRPEVPPAQVSRELQASEDWALDAAPLLCLEPSGITSEAPPCVLVLSLGLPGPLRMLEEVLLQRNFDAQKVEGHWLTIRLATSDAELFSLNDPVRLSVHSIWTRDSGAVDFMLFWGGEGLWEELNFTVHPMALQDQYQGSSRRMYQDPQGLGWYPGYVRKFCLEKAPVFNVHDQCPPPQTQATP